MKPVVYSRSESYRQFLRENVQCPLEFSDALDTPDDAAGRIYLLHVSSFEAESCQAWVREHAVAEMPPVGVCSNQPNVTQMLAFVRHGARAYCNSHMATLHYCQMLEMLANGQSWFPPDLLAQTFELAQQAAEPAQPPKPLHALTARENEIAGYVAKGLSNREIALHLGISEPTVKSHLTQIFRKLELNDRVGLVLHLKRA